MSKYKQEIEEVIRKKQKLLEELELSKNTQEVIDDNLAVEDGERKRKIPKIKDDNTKQQELGNDEILDSQLVKDAYNTQNEHDEEQNEEIQEKKNDIRKECPFIITIKRHLLDFDFEKLCSISLANLNVYACLICGKYYQGRGRNTHAYLHSLETNHHMYINLHNAKVYCLPDNYEVIDQSLNDIKYNLAPVYSDQQLANLDTMDTKSRALNGIYYQPGFVGLNNIKMNDYVNVIIQALCRIPVLRNQIIRFNNTVNQDVFDLKTLISKRFSNLVKKIWNPRNFKGQVSPHELLQAIVLKSKKKFTINEQSDPIKLLSWLLNNIQSELSNTNYKNLIDECFKGEVEIHTYTPLQNQIGYSSVPEIENKPFIYLTLNIPPPPLHKDDHKKINIPEQPLFNLLKKFDGITTHDNPKYRKTYRIKKLPKYLILHMERFTFNKYYLEKNPTIVRFPLNNLDLKGYIDEGKSLRYNLLVNICHEGTAKAGTYKIHVRNKANNTWFEIQDLYITQVLPQRISVSEAYIQIYERIDD
ncbi:ubiquitin specific protease 39 and snRNP assembly factor (macronuclear) [Tetrahymena thermophila SB210]|uniref:Ubiquitin specific protease 39 and snRNP assembly factor n=1 Tax=Tetrahymena thermophila (strain SB210) TaxID=312017 RepID=A4VF07_TETTS|nr:ubiquitin specific protease 39 and snRNP assembly factor [Tetrahymena thermophila SB210]EDK31265.1 ubiquitin specific protease 39 and snRNP assembly factor [Tetrahymena thermophila SB210]|eukprot:XP_001470681.1 ubiquitin specific protease 39 and snRNP assembly factor [Tetrahymena thermophila SB210]